MYQQFSLCLFCCVILVTTWAGVPTEHRTRRQAADFQIAQYRACMSEKNLYNKGCRNIGWGLVDILRSGRRKKADLAPFHVIVEERNNDRDDLDDIITYM